MGRSGNALPGLIVERVFPRYFAKALSRLPHGVIVVNTFFENVEGDDGGNRILQFTPRDGSVMLVACLWSRWVGDDGQELLSFAAITDEPEPEVAAAGWALTAGRVATSPEGLDIPGLLATIEARMKDAPGPLQWAMNLVLATIGIELAGYRARALEIAERLEVLKDYPTPRGCTSPYAPAWIAGGRGPTRLSPVAPGGHAAWGV